MYDINNNSYPVSKIPTNHDFSVRQNSANHGISTRLIAFLRYLFTHWLWNSALEQPSPHYQRRASDREPMVRRSVNQQEERHVERRTEHASSPEVKSTSPKASLLAIRYSIPIEYRVACYFSFPLVLGLGLVTVFATKQDFSTNDLYLIFLVLKSGLYEE